MEDEMEDVSAFSHEQDSPWAVDEHIQFLTRKLDNQTRSIVMLLTQGYTQKEIAQKLDITTRTVQRKLAVVRQNWQEEHGFL